MTHHHDDQRQDSLFDHEKETKAVGSEQATSFSFGVNAPASTTRELALPSVKAPDDRRLSTKRIAEITGKEHRNVLRDVREMCQRLGITPFITTAQNLAVDSEGVTAESYASGEVLQYYLDEHYCRLLATRYDIRLADLILREWEQLKKQQHALPNFADPAAAAEAWAAEYRHAQKLEAENRVLEQQKAVLLPKADIADKIANSDKYFPIDEVAKLLHIPRQGPNLLFALLRRQKAIYKRDGVNRPYQDCVEAGYLVLVEREIYKNGHPEMYSQVMVTGKGISWVVRLVEKDRQEQLQRGGFNQPPNGSAA